MNIELGLTIFGVWMVCGAIVFAAMEWGNRRHQRKLAETQGKQTLELVEESLYRELPPSNGIILENPIRGFKNPVWAIALWFQGMGVSFDQASFMKHAQGREHMAVSIAGNRDVHDLCVAMNLCLWINPRGQAQIGTYEEFNT